MRLYLVRHGETDSNKRRLLQGHTDSELNEYGRELARRTRDGLKDVPFAAVYTSPLKRAKETARIIMDKRDIPFYEDSRIQEMGFGIYEGLCVEKEHYNVPDPAFLNFFYRPSEYKVPEGGESFQDVM
ncbi:MAG: histidine phosphatase family protein, partial [Lachnospiraceae bacterium]|nr:histidine phosphatase family protein [Lachnospiraceae bacterium]